MRLLLIAIGVLTFSFLIVWLWMRSIVGPPERIRREIAHEPDSQDDVRLAEIAGSSSSHGEGASR